MRLLQDSSLYLMSRKGSELKNIVLSYTIVLTVNGQLVLDTSFMDILGKISSPFLKKIAYDINLRIFKRNCKCFS